MEQVDNKVDSKATRKARLTQYRKNAGRWQFFAVARSEDGKPNPEKIVIAGQRVIWQSPGAKFYLDWFDPVSGKRIREIAGIGPREPAKRRKLSAVSREKIAAAQRKRWANAKKVVKSASVKAAKEAAPPAKKRKLSAAACKRIAAAQKKRWAAVKAAKKAPAKKAVAAKPSY